MFALARAAGEGKGEGPPQSGMQTLTPTLSRYAGEGEQGVLTRGSASQDAV
jgi:hypothetical protein